MSFLRCAALALLLATGARADEPPPEAQPSLADRLPRHWCGTFRWDSDTVDQRVSIKFDRVEARADGTIEASGPGLVRTNRTVAFAARAEIDPKTRRIELFERVPAETLYYTTDGSHVGELAPDLQSVRLVWTTRNTGARGRMELIARPPEAGLDQPCGLPSS